MAASGAGSAASGQCWFAALLAERTRDAAGALLAAPGLPWNRRENGGAGAEAQACGGGLDSVLVLGIGNVLMGDEGAGVHAVSYLARRALPPGVELLDGGTGGFHLLAHLQRAGRVILIDATRDGQPEGIVRVTRPRFASEFPRALSAHDIGLRDLIESAQLAGGLPPIHLVTISIEKFQRLHTGLSGAVEKAMENVAAAVESILQSLEQETLP
jgi:hydrogenase maturation protease